MSAAGLGATDSHLPTACWPASVVKSACFRVSKKLSKKYGREGVTKEDMKRQPLAYTDKHRQACESICMCQHIQTHVYNLDLRIFFL